MSQDEFDGWHMGRALELAARGQGFVEPNPMVGCVLVGSDGGVIAEGSHQRFGGNHAEVEALMAAGDRASGATAYVTLEPCCHTGKTPPCTRALIAAGIRRVVVAMQDPFPQVSGRGLAELCAAGIEVEAGILADAAASLNAPYLKLLRTGRPWVIAKWAMSLDGKIATHCGESRWISGPAARQIVHELRGRVDGILVGRGTAMADDPLLVARPAGKRRAVRIVADTHASLPIESQLVRTARETPLLIATGPESSSENRRRLFDAGCEVFVCEGDSPDRRLAVLLDELGRRRMTNVLVEGGSSLLGSLMDARAIDEVHAFIAPKLIGGGQSPSPLGGHGLSHIADALLLADLRTQHVGSDLYITARVAPPLPPSPALLAPSP